MQLEQLSGLRFANITSDVTHPARSFPKRCDHISTEQTLMRQKNNGDIREIFIVHLLRL